MPLLLMEKQQSTRSYQILDILQKIDAVSILESKSTLLSSPSSNALNNNIIKHL